MQNDRSFVVVFSSEVRTSVKMGEFTAASIDVHNHYCPVLRVSHMLAMLAEMKLLLLCYSKCMFANIIIIHSLSVLRL